MIKPRTQPLEKYNKMWLGAITLGLIVAVVAVIFGISGLSLGQAGYRGEFAQAAQLRKGDQVTVAGINVGAVNGVQLAGDHVVVKFNARKAIHLGPGTHAAIKLTTLLGRRYLELLPAGNGPLPNRTIRLANTAVPYNLQQTLADATTTFEQVDADRIATSLTSLTQGLDGVPDALPQALTNVKALAGIVSTRRDQIGALLRNVDSLTAMIRDQKADLGSLVIEGRDLLNDVVSRSAAVHQLFDGTTALVNRIKAITDQSPALNEMLANMREFAQMMGENDALIRNTLQTTPLAFRNLANASGSGTALDVALPAGMMVDSWMCALSQRAKQFNLAPYYSNCKPAADPFPGWPPPDPARLPK